MKIRTFTEIVSYDGGDIVFGEERSNQWMQWNSGIWWWGHCLWCRKVKPVDAVRSGCSGLVIYGCGDIVFGAKKVKPEDTVDAVCSTQWNSVIWWWGHCL